MGKNLCFATEQDQINGVVTEFSVREGYESELANRLNAGFNEDFLYHQAVKDNAIVSQRRYKK